MWASSDSCNNAANRWRESKDSIELETSIGAFIISDAVDEHLTTLRKELADSVQHPADWYGEAGRKVDALDKGIKAIRECARKELKRDYWWKQLFSN